MDDPVIGTIAMFENWGIFFWSMAAVLSMGAYNWTVLLLLKEVSCTFSTIMSTMITISVWIISLLVGLETFSLVSSSI